MALCALVTDRNPQLSAQALDDRTLKIQIIEVGTILSTACHHLGIWDSGMYHPNYNIDNSWCLWTSHSKNNFRWMHLYAEELLREYRHRCPQYSHTSVQTIQKCWDAFRNKKDRPIRDGLEEFPNETEWKALEPIPAYRKLLLDKKFNSLSIWSNRNKPSWYQRKAS